MISFEKNTSLADLMTMAVDDMEALIDDPAYLFTNSVWLAGGAGRCCVCTAGAVMVNRLGADTSKYVSPSSFPDEVSRRLCAIDDLRTGNIRAAGKHIGLDISYNHFNVPYHTFHNNNSARPFIKFWKDGGLRRLRHIEKVFSNRWFGGLK